MRGKDGAGFLNFAGATDFADRSFANACICDCVLAGCRGSKAHYLLLSLVIVGVSVRVRVRGEGVRVLLLGIGLDCSFNL